LGESTAPQKKWALVHPAQCPFSAFFSRCGLTWQLFCIEGYQSSALPSAFLPRSCNGGLFLASWLEVISLRNPWANTAKKLAQLVEPMEAQIAE
jgi:hypothetical protein